MTAPFRPLILESDRDYLRLLRRGFKRAGVPPACVLACGDGKEALRLLKEIPEPPSCVLVDLELPGRGGLKVLEWLREQPRFAEIDVYILSVNPTPRGLTRAFQLGALSYLAKHERAHDLADILALIVKSARLEDKERSVRKRS